MDNLGIQDDKVLAELLRLEADAAWNDHADEWLYSSRRNNWDWVTERMAVGGDDYLDNADLRKRMLSEGITHILDCRGEAGQWGKEIYPRGVRVLVNGTGDDGKHKTPAYFKRSIEFGIAALRTPNTKIYVHCAAGINRGPSSAAAILMALGSSKRVTARTIRGARPAAYMAYLDDAADAVRVLGYWS